MKKYIVIAIVVICFIWFFHWASSPEVRKAEQTYQVKMMTSELQSAKQGDFIRFLDGRVRIVTGRYGDHIGHKGMNDAFAIDNTPEELASKVIDVIQRQHVDAWRSAAADYARAIFKTNDVARN